MQVTTMDSTFFTALNHLRGEQGPCDYYDGCEENGWDIPQEWSEAAGAPRFTLCAQHRADFYKTFLG